MTYYFLLCRNSRIVVKRALSTTDSTVNIEVQVFREHYAVLQECFLSPDVLAGNLYARGIIDDNVRDGVQSPYITPVRKSQILLNAVEKAIKAEPQHFHAFLDILANEQTTKPLQKRLWDTYGQWYVMVLQNVMSLGCILTLIIQTIFLQSL